jgi:hypothetical protein
MANLKSTIVIPGTTDTIGYTVPASGVNSVKVCEIFFSNISASSTKYSVSLVKSGGTKATLIPLTALTAGECNQLILSTFLQPGDAISIVTDTANSINAIISYVEL